MTIDEAIKYVRRVEEYNRRCNAGKDCIDLTCREKEELYKQLAEWLEELKERRRMMKVYGHCGYLEADIKNKAIDDFLEKIQWEYLNSCGIKQQEIDFLITVSDQVAEQLKAGVVDG